MAILKAPSLIHLSRRPLRTITRPDAYPRLAARFLAFRFRALAAAFEALMALSLRCFGVSALARAKPPCLASSDRTFLISSSSMLPMIHPACTVTKPLERLLTPCQHGETIMTLRRAEQVLATLTQP